MKGGKVPNLKKHPNSSRKNLNLHLGFSIKLSNCFKISSLKKDTREFEDYIACIAPIELTT